MTTRNPTDKPLCERCEGETLETVDIWAQGYTYAPEREASPELEPKSFELGGRDYIVLCPDCWAKIRETIWAALCEATTCDACDVKVEYGPETRILPAASLKG